MMTTPTTTPGFASAPPRHRFGLPGSLHGRLAVWYAALITVVLTGYTAAVYFFAVVEPDVTPATDAIADDVEAQEREVAQQHLLVVLGVGLLCSVGATVLGTLFLTRRLTAPLSSIVAFCRDLGLEQLQQRVAVPAGGSDEVHELALALNATLARLDRSAGGLRRFTADASHELRTPLARLQGNLELALKDNDLGRVADALEEVAELTRLVEALLTLAHVDAGEVGVGARGASAASVQVDEIARDVVEAYDPVAADRGIKLVTHIEDGARVKGNEVALKRIISNLVDNACKFTPAGGEVTVDVKCTADARVRIVVADNGAGINAADRPRVFERFFRSDAARALPGAGLGLSITRDLARAHGGDVHLVASQTGAAFCVDLPRA